MFGNANVSWAELWSIWLMRIEEKYESVLDTELDQIGGKELRRAARGSSRTARAAKIRLLADRAERFHQQRKEGISNELLSEKLSSSKQLGVAIIILIALASLLSVRQLFVFDVVGNVNIAECLLGIGALFGQVLLPTTMLLAYVWYRFSGPVVKPVPQLLMMIVAVLQFISLLIIETFAKCLRLRDGKVDLNPDQPLRLPVWKLMLEWLSSSPSFWRLLIAWTSNLLVLSIVLAMLVGAFWQVSNSRFDFVLKTMYSKERASNWLGWIGSPGEMIGWTPPSDDSFKWAHDAVIHKDDWAKTREADELKKFDKLHPRPPKNASEEEKARWEALQSDELKKIVASLPIAWATQTEIYRDQWSFFFLQLLVIYGLIPRVLLLIGGSLELADCKREFEPDLDDPYYRNTLKNMLEGNRSVAELQAMSHSSFITENHKAETITAEPVSAKLGLTCESKPDISPSPSVHSLKNISAASRSTAEVESKPPLSLVAENTISRSPLTVDQIPDGGQPPHLRQPDALPVPHSASVPELKDTVTQIVRDGKVWYLGYGDDPPKDVWHGDIKSLGPTAKRLPSVIDSFTADTAVKELQNAVPQPGLLLIWYDVVLNLDERWKAFLAEAVSAVGDPQSVFVVFFNGAQLRDQYDNDETLVERQITAKRMPCLKSGIPRENLVEYDPQHAPDEATRKLAARLRVSLGKSVSGTERASQFSDAFAIVREEWKKIDPKAEVAAIRAATQKVTQRIYELYRRVPGLLTRFSSRLIDSAVIEKAEKIIVEKGGAALNAVGRESLRCGWGIGAALAQALENVQNNRRWLLAASVGGLVIATGGTAMLIPAAAFPALVGSIPWLAGGGGLVGFLTGFAMLGEKKVPTQEPSTEPNLQKSEALDVFIRSSCLLIAAFERQLDGEAEVARQVTSLVEAVGDSTIDTLAKGQAAIDRAEAALAAFTR